MAVGRVVIFPCGGIKRPEATVARVASYLVNEKLLPDLTMLECVPAFLRGVPEDVFMIKRNPTVVIDCHQESCGTHLMHLMGLVPAARVYLPDLARERGLSPGGNRQELDQEGQEMAQVVAQVVARAARFMLEDPDYRFQPQEIDDFRKELGRGGFDARRAYTWHQVFPGLEVPAEMPPINLE